MDETELEIVLSSKWHLAAPLIQVLLDDTEIFSGSINEKKELRESKTIRWSGVLDDGEHIIKIRLLNKTQRDTVIDNKGNILKDMLLNIDEVLLDQIELGYTVYKLCEFYPDKKSRPDLDQKIPNLVCIGYNGEWQLRFSVPTYVWLLEHF